MPKEETYIDFMVSDYSLPRVLYALDNNGVKDYAVTLEDDDLHIRIPKSHLRKVIYPNVRDDNETDYGTICDDEITKKYRLRN